jgi:LuxR family maltose regulon positive regulatory protein
VPSYYIRELDGTTLARVRLAEGRVHEALKLLDALLPSVRELGRTGALIELQALRSLCLWAHDRRDDALEALAEALRLGEPQGYVRRFVDCPAPMPTLLYEAANRGIGGSYVGRLLAALGGGTAPKAADRADAGIVEPLSGRELDVLRLLAVGLSNKQVADKLFISLATVKWHTSNVYSKLGVRNRTAAVAQARALGLLPLL